MQELIDEMKPEEEVEESYFPTINENEELPEIEKTSKVSLESVRSEVDNIVGKEYDYYKNHGMFDIVIDKETGVNYIIYRSDSKAGMTVRLNEDGTPYVSEVNND